MWKEPENRDEEPERDPSESKKSPLIPIGLAIMAVLLVPVGMYSMGPEGPIKKGDVVFSTGQHRVYFEEAGAYDAFGYPSYCVLEAREQLLVLDSAATRSDGTFVAQPLGTSLREFPSCPTSARINLHMHQLTLKADILGELRDTLTRLFSSE